MLSGLPSLDLKDWMVNTEYSGYEESDDVIKVPDQTWLLMFKVSICYKFGRIMAATTFDIGNMHI